MKVSDYQARVQKRQGMIDGGLEKARSQVERDIVLILREIMRDRGATIAFDKSSIVRSAGVDDVTAPAIQRLDQKLSRIKVQLIEAPADSDE